MKNINWNEIEDAERRYPERPVPGGYVCRITEVEDHPEKDYLLLRFDVAEGPSAGYMQGCQQSFDRWPSMGSTIRSYSEKAQSWFKGFVRALEESNEGFRWTSEVSSDPTKLCGLEFGAILAQEEYSTKDGMIGEALKVRVICSAGRIRSGNYTVPGCKRLKGSSDGTAAAANQSTALPAGYAALEDDDDDLPF